MSNINVDLKDVSVMVHDMSGCVYSVMPCLYGPVNSLVKLCGVQRNCSNTLNDQMK
jgi:hypothetical protein